ncbi:hypothetical protein H0N96_00855 [Candidatus Micrarchaeota archaeon]|nr:hypothetical protein [Candidatus Micrarchaeota archaeon]
MLAMKPNQLAALLIAFTVLFLSASASAYVAPNLLFCKNLLTLKAGTAYVNGVAQSATGIIRANAGDELAFDFTIANENSPACQKPITGILAFYGSSKDYSENWFSYETSVETAVVLKNLPGSFMKLENPLPIQYSFVILQSQIVRAKLVVKTPANAKSTVLAFGVATAYLVPSTKNEVVLDTASLLDFKTIALSGVQAIATPTAAPVQATQTPTAAPEQVQKPFQVDWTVIIAILALLAIAIIAYFFLSKPRASRALETLPREHARAHFRERKHASRKRAKR